MLKIEWKEEFDTGNPAVDHEHRQMVERLNEFFEMVENEGAGDPARRLLGEIHAWISAHFALEEQIMRDRRYDEYDDHKEDHERLLDEIRGIMDDVEAGSFGGLDADLQSKIHDWFVEHFKEKDSRLHRTIGPI